MKAANPARKRAVKCPCPHCGRGSRSRYDLCRACHENPEVRARYAESWPLYQLQRLRESRVPDLADRAARGLPLFPDRRPRLRPA